MESKSNNTLKKKIKKIRIIKNTKKNNILLQKNLKNNNKNNFIKIDENEWININNKNFQSFINNLFDIYKLTNKTEQINRNNPKPFLYQKFLRDYFQNDSPYRGILLYHGLGSGKTCTAVTISENLKKFKNIIIMLPAALKDNFIQNGLLYCAKDSKKYKEIPGLIDESYSFISTNASNTLAQIEKIGTLDNHVIIIEEAHNLVSKIVSGLMGASKQGHKIYDILMNSKNVKIIAMTGTPIVNYPFESGILLNLLKGNMFSHIFKIDKMNFDTTDVNIFNNYKNELDKLNYIDIYDINLSNKTIEFTFKFKFDDNNELFNNIIQQIILLSQNFGLSLSYALKKKFTLFPNTQEEFNNYFLNESEQMDKLKNIDLFMRRASGLISFYENVDGDYPSSSIQDIYIEMSNYQYFMYEKMREIERVREKFAAIKSKSTKKNKASQPTSLMRIYSRQFSNFAFPKEIPRPFPRGTAKLLELTDKNSNKNKENIKKIEKEFIKEEAITENIDELDKEYKLEIDRTMNELLKDKDKYLTGNNLIKLSSKMNKILDNINNNSGINMVYSQFRTLEGIGIFELILKANGYSKFDDNNNNNNNKNSNKIYAIYSGLEDSDYRKKILKTITSKDNSNGNLIKVLLISSAGAEGLDLKNIRCIHIMEPYWNEIKIKQVIGRGVRRNSHIDLPLKDRNVKVFRYYSILSDQQKAETKEKETTDQYVYNIAKRKEGITNDILQLFKEVSIDCYLNKKITNKSDTIKCFNPDSLGIDNNILYLPDISKDFVYGKSFKFSQSSQKKTKRELIIAYITKNNDIIIPDKSTKKAYSVIDYKNKINEYKGKLDIKKRIYVDIISKNIYDYDLFKKGDYKIIGSFDKYGKFI